jgi:pilus assembly protein CpaB
VMAAAHGSVHFDLRNGADQEQLSNSPLQLSQLQGTHAEPRSADSSAPRKIATAAQPKSSYIVETIAGGKQTVATFQ